MVKPAKQGELQARIDAVARRSRPGRLPVIRLGALEAPMRASIAGLGLERMVTMRGPVDCHATLVPEVRSDVDAYLMLHRQSDPSCTTLETLACCVAVVGYHNMTLGGMLALADVGVGVAMDDAAAAAAPGRR